MTSQHPSHRWPRNREAKGESGLDGVFRDQANTAREKGWRYDSVKKIDVCGDYVWIDLVQGRDLSGREERLREKAMARREERLREEAVNN